MPLETAPILRAFAVGKRKQDERKSRETPEEREKREKFKQRCVERDRFWEEKGRQQKLKEDEKHARKLARKQKQTRSMEIMTLNNVDFIPESENLNTPQIQQECRPNAQGGIGFCLPTPAAEPKREIKKPNRPQTHKKINQEMKTRILEHYCYLRRNNRKAPLQNTVLYAEQLQPPVYVSDSTLHSWINNPKNGVNRETWKVEEAIELASCAGRKPVLEDSVLDYLQERLSGEQQKLGGRVSIPMAQSLIKNLLQEELGKGDLIGDGPGEIKISRTWTQNFLKTKMASNNVT